MKRILLSILLSTTLCFGLFAQDADKSKKLQKRQDAELIRIESSVTKSATFANQYFNQLGLSSPEDLKAYKTMEGLEGWTRIRMKQYYQGLRVVGAAYILHEKDGVVKKASGDLLPYISLSTKPALDAAESKFVAARFVNSTLLSNTGGKATVLPEWDYNKAELVVIDKAYPEFSGDYTLAYHVIVSNLDGPNQYKQSVYVDAMQSNIIASISEIAHTNIEGIANTNYYGEQRIIVDSLAADHYVLQDFTRGGGIITLNSSFEDFEDEDNFWNNFGNKEEVGTDAHYCAAAYYDYMLDNFNWNGLDGEGFELRSRVYGSENNRVNATWNGSFSTFFSGDCDQYGPLTSLDVVGHEFAHGFTEFTSGLIYQDESGALNEAISDILGKAVEFTYDPENKTWLIGARFVLTDADDHFRDMADPNTKNNPKLYAGRFWEFGTRDNGGVHINSGVLNFWFHMLTEGKTDVNEIAVEYDVPAIGLEKAASIVFTMNTAYLTESSTYTKAVAASIESVKDLYGENSAEMASVLEAWKAVGLFPESGNYDLSLEIVEDRVTVCSDELNSHFLDVFVTNVGVESYTTGDEFKFLYTVEGNFVTERKFTLVEDLSPGDTLFYTFPETVPLNEVGQVFDIEVQLDVTETQDPDNIEIVTSNNNALSTITTTTNSGLDISVNSLTLTSDRVCGDATQSQIRLGIQNSGCSDILEGDYPITIFAAGSEYNYDIRLPFDLRAGSFATLFDVIVLPEEIQNGEELSVTFSIPDDVDPENDSFEGQYLFLETVGEGFEETFADFSMSTDKRIFIDSDFRSDAEVGRYNDNEMLVISGLSNQPFALENCVEQDLFFRENFQKTDIDMCLNTEGLIDPTFSFDLVQFRSDAEIENVNPGYSVMVQVTIDGEALPIIFDQEEGEIVKHQFPLETDFVGELLIEVITLRGNGAFVFNNNFSGGDFALIDNVRLSSGTVSTKDVDVPNDISVYPNPSQAEFSFSTTNEQAFDLMIYDGLGRQQVSLKAQRQQVSWDSQSFAEGVYFYELIFEDGGRRQGKLVVGGR